ncbi:MAG TPA: hypothetical protein VGM58_02375 [Verrucomicrobiae bacterium]
MASDSRLTFTNTNDVNGQKVINFGVSQSDTSYKTFLGKGNIGISTFGTATIKGSPIRATADTMRFQIRGKTVGGPIDVLVIKPTEAFWISRKTLQKRESI